VSTIQSLEFSVDILRALLWQYNNAPRLESILTQKQAWYDDNQSAFWTDWTRDVFDLRTANAFGLKVWAIILGLPLTVSVGPTPTTAPAWAFGVLRQNFGRGNFGRGGSGSISLTLEQQRLILRLRYFQLVGRCNVPEINKFMIAVFGNLGPVTVNDNLDMTMSYTFGFAIDSQLAFVLRNFDLLPRPSTVGIDYDVFAYPVFGFGVYNLNFNNGNFPSSSFG